ncbi:unnamed protein product [Heterobilharzia americana]|nr:unnamed protein product [Heterobilharzia americana]
MGVPKFFRWISARYPCINQVLRPGEVPVIDHLYLDMNGILHNCSHPEGCKISLSEEAIFRNVCLYVQFLFNLIKPRKTFYLAVDGVAPRAKMTQQRARRFQSALEGRKAKENLKDKSPDIQPFDPCLISPGTEFMERLHRHLVNFVENHVNHDADWQCIDVILSGHDCPGEGEHKIREYMAYRRSSPDYQQNERHCIYGMDADLIFLGLTTHEVNLCILRENVVKVQNCSADNKPFCITYLSVLREYIDLEFTELKKTLPFPYDLERIIDDWIFMAFLLGNDFIPHIPNLHIHAESLLTLWDTYQVVLPKLDGYLVEFGYLNLLRFHKYLVELSQFERDWFEEREAAFHWMRGKQGARMANELEKLGLSAQQNQFTSQVCTSSVGKSTCNKIKTDSADKPKDLDQLNDLVDLFTPQLDYQYDNVLLDETVELMEEGVIVSIIPDKMKDKKKSNTKNVYNSLYTNPLEVEMEKNDDEIDYTEGETDIDEDLLIYKMHRRDYYFSKLGIQINEDISDNSENSLLMSLIQDYVKMLQWILNYYFLCIADWDFFYPYHYAPFAHDLILYTKQFLNVEDFNSIKSCWTKFNTNSQPVIPFIQQLMIMPTDSAYLVPKPYRDLMTSSSSPLAEFFPKEFETDINGKMASWEAVVLIPFIDQKRLIRAMEDGNSKLTEAEKERNQHKSHLFYHACPIGRVKSPVELIRYDFYRISVDCSQSQFIRFYSSLARQCIAEDFPSLLRLPFTYKLQKIPVHVFEVPSKLDSMALTIKPNPDLLKYKCLGEVAENILGRPVRVRWPYCATVMPVRLMNNNEIWELVDFNMNPIIEPSSSLPSGSLRSCHILSSEESDNPDSSSEGKRECLWVDNQLSSLKRYLLKRRGILFESESHDNDNLSTFNLELLPSSILVFSRPWMVENMIESTGKRGRNQKTSEEKPSMSIESAYGQCDGLDLDLLDLVLPGLPPPPAVGRCEADWGYTKPILLHTIFHPGKIVFSLARENYGSVGEVTLVNEKTGQVMVRFYPDSSSPIDLTEFRSQVEEWEHDDFHTNIVVSEQLNVPVFMVNRFTGSLMVQVVSDNTNSNDNKPTGVNINSQSDENCKSDNPMENAKDKTKQKLFSNIGLNLKRNRSGAQVLELLIYLRNSVKNASSRNNACLKLSSSEVDKITEFISDSGCRIAPVLPQNGMYLDKEWLNKLKLLYSKMDDKSLCDVFDRLTWSKKPSVKCSPTALFVSVNSNTRIYPSSFNLAPSDRCFYSSSCSSVFSTFTLLDRVVYIGVGQNIPLGLRGVVIGVPTGVSSQKVNQPLEIMFDKPFTDAIDIRGSGPCCALVQPSLLLRLPESGSKNDQIDCQRKSCKQNATNSAHHKKSHVPWSTRGPMRVYRPWPTNKSNQNSFDKQKVENRSYGNTLVNNSAHSSITPKSNSKQHHSQPKQQDTKSPKNNSAEDEIIKEMKELNHLLFSGVQSTSSASPNKSTGGSDDKRTEIYSSKNQEDNVFKSQTNSELPSPLWNMPSPPDIPLPPTCWSITSTHSKSMTDLRSIAQNQGKNSLKKNEKCVRIIVPHNDSSVERSSKGSAKRLENRYKPGINSDSRQRTPVQLVRKQTPRPNFEIPNFNESFTVNMGAPVHQMQPNWQPAYQPPPVNRYPGIPPPFMYNPCMYDPLYISYPSVPSYPPNFVSRPSVPQFPPMPRPDIPFFNPIMNRENSNRCFSQLPEQLYSNRNRPDFHRPSIRYDMTSQRPTAPQHTINQPRRFIPPQVNRTRRP